MALTKVTPDLLTLTVGDGGLTQNNFTDALKTKVDGIEASADVTDTANVTAAGALMDSELTSEASVKALNQGVATTDSPTFAGVTLATADINAGSIDGTTIGASSASTGAFTTLTASGTFTASPSGGVATLGANGHITSKQSLDVATAGGRYIGSSNRGILGQLRIEQATTGADGGYIDFDTCANGSTSPTNRMRIDSSGAVGIGTSSPATGYRLDISGRSGYDDVMRITGVGTNIGPRINLTPTGTGVSRINATANNLQLQTGGSAALTIDSSQNVGIGNSSPSTRLTVGAGSGSEEIRVDAGAGWADVRLHSDATNGGSIYFNDGADAGQIFYYHPDNTMRFHTNASERARIDSSGNLLVGTTAVDPAGNNTAGMSVGTGGGLSVQGTNTALVIGVPSAQTYGVAFRFQGNLAGRIGIEANNITVADVSDYRLKENVSPLSDALTKIKALKPSSFNFINYPDKTHEGFIAHELQEVIPYAVSGEKDALITETTKDRGTVGEIDPQAVDLRKLVPTLVAAIQEQQTLIESLTARIAALEE